MRYMKMKRVIALVVLLTVVVVAGFGHADNSPSHERNCFRREDRPSLAQ